MFLFMLTIPTKLPINWDDVSSYMNGRGTKLLVTPILQIKQKINI